MKLIDRHLNELIHRVQSKWNDPPLAEWQIFRHGSISQWTRTSLGRNKWTNQRCPLLGCFPVTRQCLPQKFVVIESLFLLLFVCLFVWWKWMSDGACGNDSITVNWFIFSCCFRVVASSSSSSLGLAISRRCQICGAATPHSDAAFRRASRRPAPSDGRDRDDPTGR